MPQQKSLILELLPKDIVHKINLKEVRPFGYLKLPHYIEIKLQHRTIIFWKYKNLLSKMDAIVCSLYNDLAIRKQLKNEFRTKLIFAGHGIANRAYSYDPKISQFDFVLVAGKKEEEIRIQKNQLAAEQFNTVGYLKFDIVKEIKPPTIFQDSKPVILYNPHWELHFSSFVSYGFSILDYFSKSKTYNLIFAPHSLLTVRNKSYLPRINKYSNYDNIHIDLGSEKCNDMSYTKMSDFYLGDISSQVLEFLHYKKRPCLFIDVTGKYEHNKDYEFHSWKLGDVITKLESVGEAIENSFANHEELYLEKQNQAVDRIFLSDSKTASEIATEAIDKYLSRVIDQSDTPL